MTESDQRSSDFGDKLFEILAKINALQNLGNRNRLLHGLPPKPVAAIPHNDAWGTHLYNIVEAAAGWGQLASGEWPLVIIAKNAFSFVEETQLGLQLEALLAELDIPTIEDLNPKQRIQIYLQGDFSFLSADRRSAAIAAFAAVMGISSQAVDVYRVYEGSIIFDLGVPSSGVRQLRSLLQSNNDQLRLLKVEKVILPSESAQLEEWMIS